VNPQKRAVRSVNRGFGELGDERAPMGVAHAIEDRLIEILDDCVTSPGPNLLCVKIAPFREFLRDYGRRLGWPSEDIDLSLRDDRYCEAQVLYTAASLRRCGHLYEWCVNRLMSMGVPIDCLPDGQAYLGA